MVDKTADVTADTAVGAVVGSAIDMLAAKADAAVGAAGSAATDAGTVEVGTGVDVAGPVLPRRFLASRPPRLSTRRYLQLLPAGGGPAGCGVALQASDAVNAAGLRCEQRGVPGLHPRR